MIVKFSTRTGALTMHGDAAVTLLKAMGHSGTVPGAILAPDLPDALAQLRRTLDTQAETPSPEPGAPAPDEEEQEDAPPAITLHMRAVPLIEMLETAVGQQSDLMWERG